MSRVTPYPSIKKVSNRVKELMYPEFSIMYMKEGIQGMALILNTDCQKHIDPL